MKFLLASDFIFSLAEDGEFIIFNIKNGNVIKKKQLDKDISSVMHPNTYVNKLLFVGENKMELWNIIEDEKIYTFKNAVEGKKNQ